MIIISDRPLIWFYSRSRIPPLGWQARHEEINRWSGWWFLFFFPQYFNSFSLSHIRIWQLSHEQAGACITANERQWVCTLITFQQPLEKRGARKSVRGAVQTEREGKWARKVRVHNWFLSMTVLTHSCTAAPLFPLFHAACASLPFYWAATSH